MDKHCSFRIAIYRSRSTYRSIAQQVKQKSKNSTSEKEIKGIYKWKKKNEFTNEKKRNVGVFNGVVSSQCAEITEYSDENEYACCTLASLCLPKFVEGKVETSQNSESVTSTLIPKNPYFDFMKLIEISQIAFRNLNRIIDLNWYPVVETEISNLKHRPVGLGVQGLVDVYQKMGLAYESQDAGDLNKKIFETIYYSVMCESCNLSRELYFKYKRINWVKWFNWMWLSHRSYFWKFRC